MDDLEGALAKVRRRIAKGGGSRRLNEQDTKATLIEPVLRALGWDVEDIDQVQREFKARTKHDPVDYALLLLRTPKLLIEAKALAESIEDHRVLSKIVTYAGLSGVSWVLVTNGDAYALYNALAKVPIEQKLFRSFKVSDGGAEAAETLRLLGTEALNGSRLDDLWRNYSVDGRVQEAIESLFANGGDSALAKLIVRRTEGLGPAAVRASIGRARVSIEFPVPPTDVGPVIPPRPVPGGKHKPTKPRLTVGKSVSLLDLLEAGLLVAGQEIVKVYKETELRASVDADGRIRFGGKTFDSLSMAGSVALESVAGKHPGGKKWPVGGWTWWGIRDDKGRVRPLDDLRQELIKRQGRAK